MSKPVYPSDKQDQYMVRFPEGMRDRIKHSAEETGRSMNAEIIQRLKGSFDAEEQERLTLNLPMETWNALSIDSAVHGITDEQQAIKILQAAYDRSSDYTVSLLKVDELATENAHFSELVANLKEKENADFLLYYAKTVQFGQFIKSLLAATDAVPPHIGEMARDLEGLNRAEIETLRKRYDEIALLRRTTEHWRERSRRIDKEISDNEAEGTS